VLLVCDDDSAQLSSTVAGCMIRDGAEMVAVVGVDGPARIHRSLARDNSF
jgi:hypothetical protein